MFGTSLHSSPSGGSSFESGEEKLEWGLMRRRSSGGSPAIFADCEMLEIAEAAAAGVCD